MKASVMELEPEIVIVSIQGKEENPKDVQDLTTNASVFAENAQREDRRPVRVNPVTTAG